MSAVRISPQRRTTSATGTVVHIASLDSAASLETVFAPVHSLSAFEETVERLGTAIRLGLLPPGTRLPAERELCAKLGIARSTLRQALLALAQSGHLHATRGRSGGTFVAERLPPAAPPSPQLLRTWRAKCDQRVAVEAGVAVLATERATDDAVDALDQLSLQLESMLDDFAAYRQADVRLHVGLAEATGSPELVSSMTEVQGSMTGLIDLIAHPPEVLASSNAQHRRVLDAVRGRDQAGAVTYIVEHVRATEHILAGLMPAATPSQPPAAIRR